MRGASWTLHLVKKGSSSCHAINQLQSIAALPCNLLHRIISSFASLAAFVGISADQEKYPAHRPSIPAISVYDNCLCRSSDTVHRLAHGISSPDSSSLAHCLVHGARISVPPLLYQIRGISHCSHSLSAYERSLARTSTHSPRTRMLAAG
jgi:hypothetical protein